MSDMLNSYISVFFFNAALLTRHIFLDLRNNRLIARRVTRSSQAEVTMEPGRFAGVVFHVYCTLCVSLSAPSFNCVIVHTFT
jgi:hypothetical protein